MMKGDSVDAQAKYARAGDGRAHQQYIAPAVATRVATVAVLNFNVSSVG